MNPPKSDQARWYEEEVQPHTPLLKAYLHGAFPAVRDVDDVVQESCLRVWKAQTAGAAVESARSFLFRVARNLALDLLRRGRRSPIIQAGDLAALDVIEDRAEVAEAVQAREKIAALAGALETLSPRHRQALILCKLQSKSYREAATIMGVSEKTVAEHIYRGVQRLGEELQRRGIHHFR